MEKKNYSCKIEVPVLASDAFDGINSISGWWAQNLEGNSTALNDVFTVHFGETFGTFRVTEMIPGAKVVWFCEHSYLDLLKDKTEWEGSSVVWQINPIKNGCSIKMTHLGLVPGKECYKDCEQGWNFYIKESLLKFLTERRGEPGVGIRARINVGDRVYQGTLYSKSDGIRHFEGDYIVLDVRTTDVERVTAVYSVLKHEKAGFTPTQLKGARYMMVENKPLCDGVDPFEDLLTLV